jgi:hypothetical protein
LLLKGVFLQLFFTCEYNYFSNFNEKEVSFIGFMGFYFLIISLIELFKDIKIIIFKGEDIEKDEIHKN